MRSSHLLLALLATLLFGCSSDEGYVCANLPPYTCDSGSIPDGGSQDGPLLDQASEGPAPADIEQDRPSIDSMTSEGAVWPDTYVWPDIAPPPDTYVWPDIAPPPSCYALYGSAPGFVPCDEKDTSCTFYVSSRAGMSCKLVCNNNGGGCLAARDGGNGPCTLGPSILCEGTLVSLNCTCSR